MTAVALQMATFLALVAVPTAAFAQRPDSADSQPSQTQTERDRIHSREMDVYSHLDDIPKRLAGGADHIEVSCGVEWEEILVEGPSPESELFVAACGSDLVVRGTMSSHTSHLTASQKFVYTDWNFVVDEVLLNNDKQPVANGSTITVAIDGGQIRLNGVDVTATCGDYRSVTFAANREYLLFLSFLPGSGTYRVQQPFGFAFSGSTAVGMHAHFRILPAWSSYDRERVISVAREEAGFAVSRCRKTRKQ